MKTLRHSLLVVILLTCFSFAGWYEPGGDCLGGGWYQSDGCGVAAAPAPDPTPVELVRHAEAQNDGGFARTISIDMTGADGIIATMVTSIGTSFTGATCNGVAMTEILTAEGDNSVSAIYGIAAPAAGTHDVVINIGGFPDVANMHVFAVSGMAATDYVVDTEAGASTSSPFSLSITGEEGGLIIDVLGYPYSFANFVPGTGQTSVSPDATFGGSSYKTASVGATSMSWTTDNVMGTTAHIAVSLRGN